MTNTIIHDPNWWPHRYDPSRDQIHFIHATRDNHRAAVFLTDEYLKNASSPRAVDRNQLSDPPDDSSLNFIFHSGYCCSTLLTRAFDLPGLSMGFKEPVILNDIVGWTARGPQRDLAERVLKDVLNILVRPFEDGEALVVKPSSLINNIAPQIMRLSPKAQAIFLYAPLEDFLGSIARKGMWGRLWVRELMSKQLRDGMINLGIEKNDYLKLTDLQAAAVSWLTQHACFMSLQRDIGKQRLVTIDSATLMREPQQSLKNISNHFRIGIADDTIAEIVAGPIFNSHSKTKQSFDAKSRELDRTSGQQLHSEEIEKVYIWAKIVAENMGIPLILPR